jgi:2-oxoglutarate dehydrogenase complex dehydrogenase (E1) component-like enzyme
MTADFGVNQGLVEEQFLKWVDNPLAVDEAWRAYFEGRERLGSVDGGRGV